VVSSDHLIPGEHGEIEVTVRTKGKRGRLTKNIFVFSNDPETPSVTLTISMRVKDPFHTGKYPAEAIFDKPCSECHVDRGKGKTGAELFNAVCLICHRDGEKRSNFTKFKGIPNEELRATIFSGLSGTKMPGFSWKEGGFLTDNEIDSIIKYIKSR